MKKKTKTWICEQISKHKKKIIIILQSNECSQDALAVKSDSETPHNYCGNGVITFASDENNQILVTMNSQRNSRGGRFYCLITAEAEAESCQCGWQNPVNTINLFFYYNEIFIKFIYLFFLRKKNYFQIFLLIFNIYFSTNFDGCIINKCFDLSFSQELWAEKKRERTSIRWLLESFI